MQQMQETQDVQGQSDAELLALLHADGARGCQVMLAQYTGFVFAIVRRRLGGKCSEETMEELVSDILFACYQQCDRIDLKKGSIRAYLATMTLRRCVDVYRHSAVQPLRVEQTEEEWQGLPDGARSPEEQVVLREQSAQLLAAIKELGEPDTSILIGKYYLGETAAAIGQRLSMRTGTVEMRLSRAIKKLRVRLGGGDDAS